MSTTFASIDTPTSGVGTATALSTIGPATFMLSGPAPASSVYVLEVSIDGTTFEPLTRLNPGAPLTLESVPFVSCRMRVLAGVAGVGAVVGYTDLISGRQAVSSVTLPVNGAAQAMPANQTSGKILVVSGPFDGTVTLEGASSNGVFAPIKQFTFTKLSAFDTSAFLFKVVVEQLRARLTGTGSPTITIGTSTDTLVSSGGAGAVFMGGQDTTANFFISLNIGGPLLIGAPTDGIPLLENDVLSNFLLKISSNGANPTNVILSIGESTSGNNPFATVDFGNFTLKNACAVKTPINADSTVTIPPPDTSGSGSGNRVPSYFFVEGSSVGATSVIVDLSYILTR